MDPVVRCYAPLRRHEFAELVQIAQAERRRPADQAAIMLAEALAARRAQLADGQSTQLVVQ